MAHGKGVRLVGHIDCPGGGQVVARNGYAYIGVMRAPHGTLVVDVREPSRPKPLIPMSFCMRRKPRCGLDRGL